MRLGLISDTHGLMRPSALAALRTSELILHAGDVGSPAVLEALRRIAPVVAVRGNIDKGAWAAGLPVTAVAEAGAVRIYMLHDLHELDLDPATAGFPIVLSGHSHQKNESVRNGVLYLNPGSAGPRRFRLPITLALLDTEVKPLRAKFVELNR